VDPVTEPGEPLPRDAERVGVAVETDERQLREALEQPLGVPAHAECGVDDDLARPLEGGREQVDDALEHHRRVRELRSLVLGHVQPLVSWAAGPDPHPCDLTSGK